MARKQCVSNTFTNSLGFLEIQDCTDGDDWDAHYSCDVNAYQGLRVDTRGCVYAEPRPLSVVDRVEENAFFNAIASPDDPQFITIAEFDVVNPDPCRVMTVHLVPLFTWELSPTAGAEFLLAKKITVVGQEALSDTDFVNVWQSQSPNARPKTITTQASSLLLTIDPGDSFHFIVEQQTRAVINNTVVNHYRFEAAWVGVT